MYLVVPNFTRLEAEMLGSNKWDEISMCTDSMSTFGANDIMNHQTLVVCSSCWQLVPNPQLSSLSGGVASRGADKAREGCLGDRYHTGITHTH